ncbi:hypothetical protein [Sphingobacterium hungaricum]|uniref:Yip1 domain-containing protein n=1 Tax=Sphingobacterium hungaricum TaxID=2082723 RepID=A0A928UYP3_9SPHI|nr:hypothetical protein [Sphingobacterium hungaricum]MBE8713529.1 hypothetical protein [Sphingobacterium hungaricum]
MKKISKIFINPFEDLSVQMQSAFGLIFFILAVLISYLGGIEFFGILKIIPNANIQFSEAIYTLLIDIFVLALFLFAYAYLENKKTRFIDCLNVVLLSSVVMYFVAALTLISPIDEILKRIMLAIESGDMKLDTLMPFDLTMITFFGIISLVLLVYFFYLIIVGIKLAMNGKKVYQGFIIFGLIILADTISKLIIQAI